jgi:OOP family OmpA-OmpF porin
MTSIARLFSHSAGALVVALSSQAAWAQANNSNPTTGDNGPSWIPYTASGYVGLNVGRGEYNTACGAGLTCDDSNSAFKLYTGGMFNRWLGLEFGYLNVGDADRNGGATRAQGVNLSLVATLPLGERFNIYGKAGTTYGRTKTSAVGGAPVLAGKENGWGPSVAIGASVHINRNWTAVLEHERHEFRFVGGREDVDMTSLGVKYRF